MAAEQDDVDAMVEPVVPSRHRWLAGLLDAGPGDVVADLGCGTGGTLAQVMPVLAGGGAVGVDASRAALAMTAEALATERASLLLVQADLKDRLPFADAAFDRVVCHDVLECLPDPAGSPASATSVSPACASGSRWLAGGWWSTRPQAGGPRSRSRWPPAPSRSSAPSGNVHPDGRCCLILAGRGMGPCGGRATPISDHRSCWVARGRARPPPVVLVAASVTPCRHHTGPTVLHQQVRTHADASAAMLGGDVVGTHQIPVPLKPTVAAVKLASCRLWDSPAADRTGGGAPALVDQPHHDAGPFGLVLEGLQQVGAAPLPQPQILHPTRVLFFDAIEVTHQQGPDPPAHGKLDHLPGGLVLGLVDAAAMARLHPA
jgi:SAM-dependent methyltransferase